MTSEPTVEPSAGGSVRTVVSRRQVRIAIAAAAAWLAGLALMAATTANPVVFNRTQFAAADLIVEADANEVLTVWPLSPVAAAASAETVDFARPHTVVHRSVVPLRRRPGGWEVVPVALDAERPAVPLVYPSSEQTRAGLERFLATIGRQPIASR